MYISAHTHTMKSFTFTALMLAFSAVLLTGCLSSDDDTTSAETNGCYISSAGFTYLRKHFTVKKYEGTDSTYEYDSIYSYLASDYMITVDQLNGTIYNRDSLPSGTLLDKVPLSITYVGGTMYWRSTEAFDDDPWTSFSSGDSLDLTNDLNIKVSATDGSYRIYRAHLNVHTTEGDTLRWSEMPGCDAFAEGNVMKSFIMDDKPAVLVKNGSSIKLYTPKNDACEWQENSLSGLPSDADLMTLSMAGYWTDEDPTFYLSCADGSIYYSSDAQNWQKMQVATETGMELVGASDSCLYAVKHTTVLGKKSGMLMCCNLRSDAKEFKVEVLDDDVSGLPVDTTLWTNYWQPTTQDVMRLILMGTTADGKHHTTWTKSWATDLMWTGSQVENEVDESWMMYNRTWDDIELLPAMKNPQMMYYNETLIAFGGATYNGKHPAMDSIYVSKDNGMTWRVDWTMPVASALTKAYKDNMTATFDGASIWVFTDKRVFRGVQNKLWYIRQDPVF